MFQSNGPQQHNDQKVTDRRHLKAEVYQPKTQTQIGHERKLSDTADPI